ncbi:YSC84-related protein [Bacteroidota bacterium]
MKIIYKMKQHANLVIVMILFFTAANAQIGGWDPEAEEKAQKTIDTFKEENSKFESFFAKAHGYVVFPTVAKGAITIGGAHGKGVVFKNGISIGTASLTQVTVGLQWGGQAYSEVIFFENEKALKSFKKGKLEFAGQVSAVAITKGASADIAYENGVAVYTMDKGGLMYEASIGGQKFKFFEHEQSETEDPDKEE